jgi:hypothetical protein
MVIVYKFDSGNTVTETIGKIRGNTYTYDDFISDSYKNVKNTIGLGDYLLKYIQYDNDDVNFEEGQNFGINGKKDIKDIISRITENRNDISRVIIENVEGVLYISVKPGETYWFHPTEVE